MTIYIPTPDAGKMRLRCENLHFAYGAKPVLQGTHLHLSTGEHVWLRGRSGIGKSTFLKILGGLLPAHEGKLLWADFDMGRAEESNRRDFLNSNIGYIEQDNRLIPHWTVQQNLELLTNERQKLEEIILQLGLERDQLGQRVSQLSGGERQRVDLARLLLKTPAIALIDEPTSHLDDISTEKILRLLRTCLKSSTLVIVSHDRRLENLKLRELQFDELRR